MNKELTTLLFHQLSELRNEVATLRERVAVLESQQSVPLNLVSPTAAAISAHDRSSVWRVPDLSEAPEPAAQNDSAGMYRKIVDGDAYQ